MTIQKKSIYSSIILLLVILLTILYLSGCIKQDEKVDEQQEKNNDIEHDSEFIEKNPDDALVNTTKKPVISFDELAISNYSVSTIWTSGCCGVWENHKKPGFYHQVPMWENTSFVINGTIKNNVDHDLKNITINIIFSNNTKQILFDLYDLNKTKKINKLSPKESSHFRITINPMDHYKHATVESYDVSYEMFRNVSSYKFEIYTE